MQRLLLMSLILNLFLSVQTRGEANSPSLAPSTQTAQPKPQPTKAAPSASKTTDAKKAQPKGAQTPAEPKPVSNNAQQKNAAVPTKVVETKPALDLSKLADSIQKQYNQTKSATFRFEQTYVHPFLSAQDSSKGEVSYDKSSGSMMWNYQEPKERQKKFFISGNKFTFFSITDKIAYTHNCYDKDTLSASVTFLLGTGNLKDSFTIAPFDGDVPNKALAWLSLTPKEENAPVKRISFGASSDGKVVESIVEDPSGGKNHFKFISFKANPKIDAKVFVFQAPPGVMVQPMPNVQCSPKTVPTTKPPEDIKNSVKGQPSKKG